MNLNMKLQSSAAKAQSKTIDLELKRLEAAQLAEQTKIITVGPSPFSLVHFADIPDILARQLSRN